MNTPQKEMLISLGKKKRTILQCYYWEMWNFSQKFQNLEDSSPIKIAEEINHVVVECWSFWDVKRSQVSQPLSWSLQITNEVCWAPYPCLFIGFLATRHLTTGGCFPWFVLHSQFHLTHYKSLLMPWWTWWYWLQFHSCLVWIYIINIVYIFLSLNFHIILQLSI